MILQLDIMQSPTGDYHVFSSQNLAKCSGSHLLVARKLGLTPAQYIEKVVTEYAPDHFHIRKDYKFFTFSWANRDKANAFKLNINRELRRLNAQI